MDRITRERMLSLFPPPVIFEIGCHLFEDTCWIRCAFPTSSYYCFEPDPRNVQVILREELHTKMGVNFFPYAIGDKVGAVDFYLSSGDPSGGPGEWSYSSSLKIPTGHLERHPWCKFESQVSVQCTTLDHFCKEQGVDHIDFIWADVQGAEELMLAGGQEILKKTRYLYTEHQGDDIPMYAGQKDLNDLMRMLPGWAILEHYPNDVLLENLSL